MPARTVHEVTKEQLREKARLIRLETLRMTDICGSGHYGSSFSMAEIVSALYYRFMHVRPDEPQRQDRDRFTMGKGHAAIGRFPVLPDLGLFPSACPTSIRCSFRRRTCPGTPGSMPRAWRRPCGRP